MIEELKKDLKTMLVLIAAIVLLMLVNNYTQAQTGAIVLNPTAKSRNYECYCVWLNQTIQTYDFDKYPTTTKIKDLIGMIYSRYNIGQYKIDTSICQKFYPLMVGKKYAFINEEDRLIVNDSIKAKEILSVSLTHYHE